MPLTENQIRLTATGACLSKVSVITGPQKNCFMLDVIISTIRNCNGFKVKIMKYQLKRQVGLVLKKNHQYNILGFDLNMPCDPKSFRDFRARVLQKIRFFFVFMTSILVKAQKIIWWCIWIQMDF